MNFCRKHAVLSGLIVLIILVLLFILGESTFKDTLTTTLETVPPQTQTAAVADFNSNLVAHYTFDEGSGTTAGDSSGSNTGTLQNGPVWVTGDEVKIGNGALQFSGPTMAVSASMDPIGNGEATISAWIKPSSIPSIGVIVSNNSNGFLFYITNWNNRLACTNDGGNHTAYSANNSVTVNAWHLVTAVRTSDGHCTLYVDGVQSGNTSQNAGTLVPSNGGLYIGRRPVTAYPFAGVIDDVRIYNRTLTQSEIQDIYTAGGSSSLPPNTSSGQNASQPNSGTVPATNTPTDTSPPVPDSSTSPQTVTAASCSHADVVSIIQQARDGDTVFIPSGTCVWDGLTINNKQIRIIGAGIDKTIIQSKKPISITTTKPFRMSGFTFIEDFGGILISKKSPSTALLKDWRIDHVRFVVPNMYQGNGAIFVFGPLNYGVIDHVNIDATAEKGVYVAVHLYGNTSSETIPGDLEWSAPLSLGTDNAVYIEDSVFTIEGENIGFLNDINYAGRMAIRHNSLKNGIIQTHAGGHGGRGGTSYEIYDNIFTSTKNVYRPGHLRSGTGVVFNNTVSGYNTNNFTIDNVRTSTTNGKWGLCDGTQPVDGNTPGENGWPCMGQIGRGSGGAAGHEPSEPLYAWNNNSGAAKLIVVDVWKGAIKQTDHIKTIGDPDPHPGNIVDYVNGTPRPGYTPYTYPHPLTTSGFTGDDPSKPLPPPATPAPLSVQPTSIQPAITPKTSDFNNDGRVNALDFSVLSTHWNQNNVTYDLNADGTINSLDYVILVRNWTG